MSRLQVFSSAPDGTDRVCLDALGPISALRISTSINGDVGVSWEQWLDPKTDHTALTPGRLISVPVSLTSAWQGRMGAPQRGTVWNFAGDGLSTEPARWVALAATDNNATNLNEVVDAAIGRGWSVTRPASLPALTDGSQVSGSLKVGEALGQVTQQLNEWWSINRAGQLTAFTLPTALSYILCASDTAGGRTATGFVTDVIVLYTDLADFTTKSLTRSNTTARAKYGRIEDIYDLTQFGPISTADAQAAGDNFLSVHAPRLKWTGAFQVTPGQLLNPGGTPVDLGTVQAGALVRVILTDPDTAAGETTTSGPVQIMAGQTDYDVDADVLSLTPLDTSPTGLAAVVKGVAA